MACARPYGVPGASLDAVEGRDYRLVMQPADGDVFHIRGAFRVVEPPRWRGRFHVEAGALTIYPVESPPDLDLVSASLRADADDLRVFVESLSTKLEQSFPGRCRVQRSGLFGKGGVREIRVELGDSRYELTHDEGVVSARRSSVIRGITLKSEELGLDQWIDSLAAQVVAEADRSERGRLALQKLLSG